MVGGNPNHGGNFGRQFSGPKKLAPCPASLSAGRQGSVPREFKPRSTRLSVEHRSACAAINSMSGHKVAQQLRRALRNRTGVRFSLEQIQELAEWGVLELVSKIEMNELCRAKTALSSSGTSGSTSVVTASLPTSGRSPQRLGGPLSIAALSAGM